MTKRARQVDVVMAELQRERVEAERAVQDAAAALDRINQMIALRQGKAPATPEQVRVPRKRRVEQKPTLVAPQLRATPRKGASVAWMAEVEAALDDAGVPLRMREIIDALMSRGFTFKSRRHGRDMIAGSLNRKAREGKTFYCPEPGLYGLLKWKGQQNLPLGA